MSGDCGIWTGRTSLDRTRWCGPIWVYLCDLWAFLLVGMLEAIGVSGDAIQKRDTICVICVICGQIEWTGFVIPSCLCGCDGISIDFCAYSVSLWFFECAESPEIPGAAILSTMSRGYFITFEGGEGTGKSTQLLLVNDWLKILRHTIVMTREPGGTRLAEAVRALLLDPELEPDGFSEIFLLEAARRDHVEQVIRPAIEDGAVVLCDRFTDSSLVYQGLVRGLGWKEVAGLNRLATGGLEPDLTLVFDMDPEAALRRAHSRNSEGSLRESRLDDEPAEFHRRVRDGFLELAEREPSRVQVIEAGGSPEEVFARVHPILPEALR